MREQTKNMLIGVFILTACFLVISIIMFLKPSVGDGKKTLYVRFSNINKIGVGTRVMFAGKPVGEVVSVEEIYNAREQPSDVLGQVYFYQLILKVDSSVKVYNTDEIALQTSGLLGEKSIAIIPKTPPVGVIPKLIQNEPIYANSVDPLENTFDEISDLANKAQASLDHFSKWMSENSDDISFAIKKFGEAMNQITIATTTLNEQRLLEEIKNTAISFQQTANSITDTILQLKEDNAFTNLALTLDHTKNFTQSLETIGDNLVAGKGTIGKLLENDDLYLRFSAIMSKADTMMNDINHYGILFHLNKNWQRTRMKQMTELDALQTPDDFRRFFESQVDQINTSMSRISILVDKADASPAKERIFESTNFKKDFAELLREIDELSNNLKLYNQKLSEMGTYGN